MPTEAFHASFSMCSVEGCPRTVRARGWCGLHYQRWKLKGDVFADVPSRVKTIPVRKCIIDGCENDLHARGWCYRHYERWQAYGDPETPLRRNRDGEGYRGLNHDGYVVLKRSGKTIFEHRQIMEEMLGRPMLREETVHHRNGKRDDNRRENLELWVSTRSGQRVADLVAFVVEHYRTEVLRALGGK